MGAEGFPKSASYQLARFPSDRIVGGPAIDVFWLNRAGALVVGTVTNVTLTNGRGARLTRKPGILEIGRHPVSVVCDQPMPGIDRLWFLCPVCGRRCRHVYLRDVIACRRCCCFSGPLDLLVRFSRMSIADEMREEHRRGVLGE